YKSTSTDPQRRRFRFLHDSDPAVAPGRVENPPVADPERHVIHRVAVGDEIADRGLGHLAPGLVLLPRVARYEVSGEPEGHVHEAGAIDSARGHAAPLVGGADVGAGDLERRVAAELLVAHPAAVVVLRPDAHPTLAALLQLEPLAAQCLRDLLGMVGRCRAQRRDVDPTPHRTCFAIFSSSMRFTRGQSSSTTAYQAESRIESGRIMCFRKIPSKLAPTPRSAPRTRRLRASVLNSTRIAPHDSNACRKRRYFVSTLTPFPH